MGPTMKDFGIDVLSPSERRTLALEIWESLEGECPNVNLSAEQRAELKRRDAELDANPEMAMNWEQIRASVEGNP